MAKTSAAAAPLMENEYVRELLSILRNNDPPSKNGLLAVLNQVTAMEKQLEAAVKELAAMRRDLAEAERRNHPIKNALQKAVIVVQNNVLELRDKLATLKQAVIDGCKNAVAAFKEKGIAAFDNIARFFKVRPILEAMHTGANRAAQSADKAIANIEAVSAKYHEAGRRVKNAGRALAGKEAVQEARPNGKVSRTFTAPFRAAFACFTGIGNHAAVAVRNLKGLEEQAAARKPPIRQTMREYNEKIAREGLDAPSRKKARAAPEL